jgi:serine/threonine protein kinase
MPPPEREEPTQLGTNPALGHAGPYALIDTLGKGGMARVYLARHTGTGSLYALKRPHPDMRNDPGIRGRFEREVEIGRRLKHPGIPRLIEADTAADWPYAVFELVPGLNLDQLNRILAENGRLLPYPVTMSLPAGRSRPWMRRTASPSFIATSLHETSCSRSMGQFG